MKTIRADLTAFSLTGLIVVAAVVLIALGHEVPAFLVDLGLISAGVGGGASLPSGATSTTTATSSALVDQAADVVPAPAPAPAVESLAAAVAAAPAKPGRDWTETIPAITPAMIAADKAAQA